MPGFFFLPLAFCSFWIWFCWLTIAGGHGIGAGNIVDDECRNSGSSSSSSSWKSNISAVKYTSMQNFDADAQLYRDQAQVLTAHKNAHKICYHTTILEEI